MHLTLITILGIVYLTMNTIMCLPYECHCLTFCLTHDGLSTAGIHHHIDSIRHVQVEVGGPQGGVVGGAWGGRGCNIVDTQQPIVGSVHRRSRRTHTHTHTQPHHMRCTALVPSLVSQNRMVNWNWERTPVSLHKHIQSSLPSPPLPHLEAVFSFPSRRA